MKKLLFVAGLLLPLQSFALYQKQQCHLQKAQNEVIEIFESEFTCPQVLNVTFEKVPVDVNTKMTLIGQENGKYLDPVDFYIYEDLMTGYNKFHACTGKWGDYIWYQEYEGLQPKLFMSDTEVGATLTSDHCTYTCYEATPH